MQAAATGGSKESHDSRLANWKKARAANNAELRERGHSFRRDALKGDAGRAFAEAAVDKQCRRCGMCAEEHNQLGHGSLQRHHLIAIRDGGRADDPANLCTLCYFCHREWHTWWEGHHEWPEYMDAVPYRVGVVHAGARGDPMPAGGCRRCGVKNETFGSGFHSARTKLKPFKRVNNERDHSMLLCYWCQREWEIFWRSLRPDVRAFHWAQPFKPTPRLLTQPDGLDAAAQPPMPPPSAVSVSTPDASQPSEGATLMFTLRADAPAFVPAGS